MSEGGASYLLEYAKSGRATCKGACKTVIEKNELRFGVQVEIGGHASTFYRKLGCVTPKQVTNILGKLNSAEAIPGFESLKAADKTCLTEQTADTP